MTRPAGGGLRSDAEHACTLACKHLQWRAHATLSVRFVEMKYADGMCERDGEGRLGPFRDERRLSSASFMYR